MNISLIIYPSTQSTIVKWPSVPHINEVVFYKEKRYRVSEIWHSMDLGEIKIFLVKG